MEMIEMKKQDEKDIRKELSNAGYNTTRIDKEIERLKKREKEPDDFM